MESGLGAEDRKGVQPWTTRIVVEWAYLQLNSDVPMRYALAILLFTTACADYERDPNERVGRYREGQLESDVRREVGPPTRERQLAEDKEPCRLLTDGTSVRELSYDIPSRGAEKRLRELFRIGPAASWLVCVNADGRLTGVIRADVN